MELQPLLDKVAIVTGAARGIGYGIARRYAEEGASVVLADINEPLVRESAERIKSETGRRALGVACDVTDRRAVDDAISFTLSEFGSLDIAVANAGICPFVQFLELDNATWQRTIDVILTGSFNTSQAAARAMIGLGKPGRIIFTTSLSTLCADSSQADYAAAKSGVRMLMASIAGVLAKHGITANAIAPGIIYTEMGKEQLDVPEIRESLEKVIPLGRLGTPADIAGVAVFLASEDAAYITGSTIRVDGGRLSLG
jgi:NAD(P)-dependent dehydrogenase (short-subunit alcohol dehydrogenase family)